MHKSNSVEEHAVFRFPGLVPINLLELEGVVVDVRPIGSSALQAAIVPRLPISSITRTDALTEYAKRLVPELDGDTIAFRGAAIL